MQLLAILFPACALAVLAVNRSESYAPISAALLARRQLMTCNETYGAGFESCGGPDSTFCYNAGIGQTCCPDKGYCDAGTYCAPVAGYCCDENEDLPTCARNAGFTLPASLAAASATATGANVDNMTVAVLSSSAEATVFESSMTPTPLSEATAFQSSVTTAPSTTVLEASSLPTVDSEPIFQSATPDCISTVSTVTGFGATSLATQAANNTGTAVPFVQVAVAAKRGCFAPGSILVGLTGIFAAF
ncbi:hypothetical protein BJ166DRAFT_584861 [Pestalotiopsis sp. NC0098]|nr:hypothetical protein BJ166DRAFT_584861 [Pestalotiopsis sp. NC0098]